jgi:ribosomal protein S18 acetylase RimI-like enzyme
LSKRVEAPAELLPPASTPELTWRPATPDDIPGLLELDRESAVLDHPHYVLTYEEIADEFEASWVDPAKDTIVATDPDGRVIAYGISTLSPSRVTLARNIFGGAVLPAYRGRGIGSQIADWLDARGRQHLAALDDDMPAWLMVYLDQRQQDAAKLFTDRGYTIARYFLGLRRDLAEPIESRPLADGLRLEPYTPDWSERTRDAYNDAFRDHWGSQPSTEEGWRMHRDAEVARNDLSFLAIGTNEDGAEEVAGYVLASVRPDDFAGQGFTSSYVDLVGTRRAWRRRGIAPALLTAHLVATKRDGLEKSVLDVDAENPTGALGLYESLGFAESNRTIAYTKVL